MPSSPGPARPEGEPGEIGEALLRLARTLGEARLGYALIGALGAAAFGLARLTRDIGLCVDLEPSATAAVDDLLARLAAAGFCVEPGPVRRRLARGIRIITVHRGRVRVDLFLRRADGYWDSVLAHRLRRRAFGLELEVAAPEDLIAVKLASDRARDHEDARALLEANRDRLDLPRLRAVALRLDAAGRRGAGERLERLLREAAAPDGPADATPAT